MPVATQTLLTQLVALTGLVGITAGYAGMIKARARRRHVAGLAWPGTDGLRGQGKLFFVDAGWAVIGLLALVTTQGLRAWRAVQDGVHGTSSPPN